MSTAREHWEARYADSDRIWSGRPNATLVGVVGALPPGRALDLGAGEGADALWLASLGWSVTGLDLSETALDRAREAATAQGVSVDFVQADLAGEWPVEGLFDLVTASFLHSMVEFPRTDVLRRAAGAVAPGGRLAVVSHAAPPPWASGDEHRHGLHLSGPEEEFAELALDPSEWTAQVVETRERAATAPDGTAAVLLDGVLLLQRRA
ncbi:class I SAM-dependent methyltransferase [Rathayibacter rathayi]|uniref:class I SAM-dependent methyltransferase n=1 Tax=Rathayibacter rathayi TaxID=33887 RepID=UPI000BD624F7|nr:class I SAM-dependent methyltransferase [Rathayibacter rathayi]AZZ50138.1 class I SAM-dependent methyltransferase [Rathayibacter rathayi]MWV74577.1 methyltransferase domain-containing protein [Rathayibacter rathayi NCPPB 2980 = VKM Ac-1601]PPF49715.1 class I SAM-dependent methyltransferase [Rathayibacter rathayi]PPF79575.1 class I SAM-dependent methyltransferase [Rathayibacter rathayi]PPG65706.1 class I SAM-dependent methyltransferase [Rathayibacter rathayi]